MKKMATYAFHFATRVLLTIIVILVMREWYYYLFVYPSFPSVEHLSGIIYACFFIILRYAVLSLILYHLYQSKNTAIIVSSLLLTNAYFSRIATVITIPDQVVLPVFRYLYLLPIFLTDSIFIYVNIKTKNKSKSFYSNLVILLIQTVYFIGISAVPLKKTAPPLWFELPPVPYVHVIHRLYNLYYFVILIYTVWLLFHDIYRNGNGAGEKRTVKHLLQRGTSSNTVSMTELSLLKDTISILQTQLDTKDQQIEELNAIIYRQAKNVKTDRINE